MSDLTLTIKLTDAGMAAVAAAHGQGIAAKITHVAVGDQGYALDGAAAATGLRHELARVALTAGGVIAPRQILLQGMFPAVGPEFFIRELGYFLEDGTLLGVWSDPATPLGWIGGATPWFFKLVFAWSALPADAITVIIADDAGQAGMALDLAQLDGKVRHTVESADIVWDGGDVTQLTDAISKMIASADGLTPAQYQRTLPATPTGQGGAADAITATYAPAITALSDGLTLWVRASAVNTTATPTFTPSAGIAPAVIVKGPGLALAPGDIAGVGHWLLLRYDATLAQWVLLNPATGVTPASVGTVDSGLAIRVTGGTSLTVNETSCTLLTAAGLPVPVTGVAVVIATGARGAGGLDTGAIAASTWYAVHEIYNPTTKTVAGLLSLSATAPTLPGGYTAWRRRGWVRTNSSAALLGTIQYGRRAQYIVGGAGLTALPSLASGGQGNISTPTWVSVSLSSVVPLATASRATFCVACGSVGAVAVMIAPNASYGGYNSSNNPPPLVVNSAGSSAAPAVGMADFALESASIYVASNSSLGLVQCFGWEDNL